MFIDRLFDEVAAIVATLIRRRAARSGPFSGIFVACDDLIGRRVFSTGWFERTQFSALIDVFENSDLLNFNFNNASAFVDVGANIGLYSIFFNQYFDRGIAVEANPIVARVLEANLSIKRADHVTVVQEGASDKVGSANILFPDGGNYGWGTFSAGPGRETWRTSRVSVRPLDMIISEHMPGVRIDIIKIDVEGHEGEVIEGSRATITSNRPVILFEALSLGEFQNTSKLLEGLGYSRFFKFERKYRLFGRFSAMLIDPEKFEDAALVCAIPD